MKKRTGDQTEAKESEGPNQMGLGQMESRKQKAYVEVREKNGSVRLCVPSMLQTY